MNTFLILFVFATIIAISLDFYLMNIKKNKLNDVKIKLEDNYEEQVNQAQFAYQQQQQQANQAFVTQQSQDVNMNQQMQFSNDQYYNQFGF